MYCNLFCFDYNEIITEIDERGMDMDRSKFIRLYENTAPGSEGVELCEEHFFEEMPDGRKKEIIQNVPVPGLYPYLLKEKAKGAVIIIPGGAFKRLVVNFEGEEIAEWFQSIGYSAFVLTPRLPMKPCGDDVVLAPHKNPENVALCDAQRAVRIVRANAGRWGYPADKIGVVGFSAGGHIASLAACCFDKAVYEKTDGTDEVSARPDFTILGYPAISKEAQRFAEKSRLNLDGNADLPPLPEKEWILEKYSTETLVTEKMPPVFLFETDDDKTTFAENSVKFYMAARRAGVPAELHIFKSGGHGFGLGEHVPQAGAWKKLCENWLETL